MKFLRNSTFLKFVISFVILICIIIGTLGALTYRSSKTVLLEQFEHQQQNNLKQLCAGMQDKIAAINEVTLLISMDSRISKAYFAEANEKRIEHIQNYREIVNYLKGLSSSVDNLISISVLYGASDVVISQSGKYNSEEFYEEYARYEGMTVQDIRSLLSEHLKFSLIHSGTANIGGNSERALTFGRTLPYDNTDSAYAIVLVTVSMDFFGRMISSDAVKSNNDLSIVKDGRVILTTEKNMSENMENSLAAYPGGNEISFDGKKYLAASLKDDFNGWTYISTIPMDIATMSISNFKLIMYGLILLVLIMGLALSMFFARKLYMPILQISHRMDSLSGDENPGDDFKRIHLGISNMLTEKNSLLSELETANKSLRAKIISDIISGRREVFENRKDWLRHGIEFPFDQFQVLVMADNNHTVENRIIDHITSRYIDELICYVTAHNNYCIMLFNYSSDDETDTKIYEIAKMLISNSFAEVIGMGKPYPGAEQTVESYIEALYALRYSGISQGIASAEDFSHTNRMKNNYTIDAEQKLIWAVKSGDRQSADAILNEFTSVYNPIVYSALALTAHKISVSYDLRQSDEDYITLLSASDGHEATKEKIMLYFHNLTDHFSKGADERYYDIYLKIKERIDKDFTKEISLQQLGDEIGYSASYLSFVFKENAKMNYLDYVNRLRIDLAKELLIKTDLPLKEISLKIGYTNTVTLNRVFKKIVGITPGKFREENI